MPPIPPTKKKPSSDLDALMAAAGTSNSATDVAEAPAVPSKSNSDLDALMAAASKKKVGTTDSLDGSIPPAPSPYPSPSETSAAFSKPYNIATLNGTIQPEGTFKPKPSPVKDLIEQMKEKGKMEGGVLTVHDNSVVTSGKDLPDIKEAIDTAVQKKIKADRVVDLGTPPSKYEIESATKVVTDAYKRGDLIPTKSSDGKSVMKRGTGFFESMLTGFEQANANNQENQYFASLTRDEKIRHLNLKQQYPDAFTPPSETAPSGFLGKTGEFLGENADMMAKGTVGAIIAPAAVPEAMVAGASNFGSFLTLAQDFGLGGYKNSYEKTYYALKKQGLSDTEAADKAEKVGLAGAATQIGVGAVLSSNIGNALAPEGIKTEFASSGPPIEAFVEGLSKSIKHLAKVEVPKMAISSGASSLVESSAEKAAGVDVKLEDALKEGANAAGNGAITALSFWGLHQSLNAATTIPSYLRPLIEGVTASVPVEAREQYLNKAVEQGVMTEEEKIKVAKTINQFGETKPAVNDLPIPEANKAAITGKLVQVKKLQEERDNLTKYGASFNDRVAQIDAKIEAIHSDVNKMYGADDVFAIEKDSLTGETPVTKGEPENISQPIEFNPEATTTTPTDNGENQTGATGDIAAETPIATQESQALPSNESAAPQETTSEIKPTVDESQTQNTEIVQPKGDEGTNINNEPVTATQGADTKGATTQATQTTEQNSVTSNTTNDAIQKQTAAEGLLRQQGVRGESGLQGVEQNNESKITSEKGEAKEVASLNELPPVKSVPFGTVKPHVFAAAHDSKIFDSVVGFIPVDMVNILEREKFTPNGFFNNHSVFSDSVKSVIEHDVSGRVDDALAIGVARLRTKLLRSLASGDFKFSPAEIALIKDGDHLSSIFGVGKGDTLPNLDRVSADALSATELSSLKSIGLDLKGSAADNAGFFNKLHRLVLDKGKENGNSNLGSEGGKPKAKVSRTKASGSIRNLSSKIREKGLLPHWAKADLPEGTQRQGFGGKELDEAVAKALDLVADAIDAGKGFSDSVNEGFAHIKDYYAKNTKSFDEKRLKREFTDNIRTQLKGDIVGISHARTAELRDKYGLTPYERNNATDAQLEAAADKYIKSGGSVEDIIVKMEKGTPASGIENFVMSKYLADLNSRLEKNATPELVKELDRFTAASDKTGSIASEQLRTRKAVQLADDSLASYLVRDKEAKGVEALSQEQIDKVVKEHAEITEAQKKYEEKIASLEKENARLRAEKKVKEQVAKVSDKTKKTKEDFVKERSEILQSIKDKWKNAAKDNMLTAVPVPYAKQLAAIAPDVAKLVRSLVEEGVTKLADVTKNVHETLKDSFPEITEKDVHDIIAGEYREDKKPTKSDIQQKLADLRTQSQLINKLEELQKGPIPKTEKERVKRSQEIEDLRKQIEDKEREHSNAAVQTKRMKELNDELQRIKDRKEKETKPESKRVIDDEEKRVRAEIDAEREKWNQEKRMEGLEGELQRAKDRKDKETDPKKKRVIGEEEQKVRDAISKENRVIALEKELQRLKDRKARDKSAPQSVSPEEQKIIDEIKKERKDWAKEREPQTKLGAIKSRTRSEIERLKEQLRTGKFEEERQPVQLDKEAIELKDKLIKLRKERESRLIHEEYQKRTKWEKFKDGFAEVIGIPRTLMSSLDYSAPLRQALVATVAHPKIAGSAAVEMFKQGFSQKRFDRWFYDVKESPRYKLMEQSGLYVADPHDPRMTAREESFMSNLGEKVPLVGETLKFKVGDKNVKIPGLGLVRGSERAYVSYLNKMRVDLFNRLVDDFEAHGKSFENDPKLFKDLATFVNNATGRGNLGFAESAGPVLSATLFSPRLIASRLSLLRDFATFGNFGKMHPEVRKTMYKDMFAFVGTGLSVLAIIKASNWATGCKDENGQPCVTLEADPRSSDFGKIKSGNMRWDIWGGFQQYIRVLTQVMSGQTKSTTSGDIQELDGKGQFGKTRLDQALSFVRGKLAPTPSMLVDVLGGKTATGEPVTLKDEAMGHLLPLIASDLKDAIEDKGVKAIFTMGIPSTFGVGVSTYLPRGYEGKDTKKDPVYSFLYKKSMAIAPPPLENVPEKIQPQFIKKREEIFKEEWDKVIKYGALIDENGFATTDVRRAAKRVDTDQLDREDFSDLMKSISTKSTRRAEKELGIKVGRKPKTRA